MSKDDVLKVVTRAGDCYRIKTRDCAERFNFYVSRIGSYGLEQEASESASGFMPYMFVSYQSIESVERY